MPSSAETHYRELLDLTRRMLAAGRAQRWDELIALERRRAAHLAQSPALATDSPASLIALIGEVQQSDAELRERVETWLAHARILLRLDGPPPADFG